MEIMTIYRLSTKHVKRQFWLTFSSFLALSVSVIASEGGQEGLDVFTRENILMVVGLIYGAATLREQFSQTRKDINDLKEELKKDYHKKDIIDSRFKDYDRRFEHLEAQREQ
jgi:hypothetical protein